MTNEQLGHKIDALRYTVHCAFYGLVLFLWNENMRGNYAALCFFVVAWVLSAYNYSRSARLSRQPE